MFELKKKYLGDALYAEWDGFQLTLKANDPKHPTDTVYLDVYVIESLLNFIKEVRK